MKRGVWARSLKRAALGTDLNCMRSDAALTEAPNSGGQHLYCTTRA
jgi:hypothetical protein